MEASELLQCNYLLNTLWWNKETGSRLNDTQSYRKHQVVPLSVCEWAHAPTKFAFTRQVCVLYFHKPWRHNVLQVSRLIRILYTLTLVYSFFINKNICKEVSRWDGSFKHTKHMLKLVYKNVITNDFSCSAGIVILPFYVLMRLD